MVVGVVEIVIALVDLALVVIMLATVTVLGPLEDSIVGVEIVFTGAVESCEFLTGKCANLSLLELREFSSGCLITFGLFFVNVG